MARIFRLLDHLPITALAILALVFGLAPFMPEPHLVEKLRMLAGGTLTRPVDIFDLFVHGLPVVLLGARLGRVAWLKGRSGTSPAAD